MNPRFSAVLRRYSPAPFCLTEEEDDAGYLDVVMSEEKHPPPQLSSMPQGLTSQQVHLTFSVHLHFLPLILLF